MSDSARAASGAASRSDLVWQTGTVRRGPDHSLELAFADPAACRRCARGEGCGAAPLSRLFVRGGASLPLDRRCGFRVGERILVGMDRRWLVTAAAVGYLLPTAAFVAGAAVAQAFWPGYDAAALALGIVGAGISIGLQKSPLGRVTRPEPVFARADGGVPDSLESADHGAHLG